MGGAQPDRPWHINFFRDIEAMTKPNLANASADDLVQGFAVVALQQAEAMLDFDHARVAGLFNELERIEAELKRRPGDARSALLALYDHPNAQVRVKAAKATLAVAPKDARRVLQDIAASPHLQQCLEAGMSLWNLERGIFKPT
jgi:hypothetical protein